MSSLFRLHGVRDETAVVHLVRVTLLALSPQMRTLRRFVVVLLM